MLKNINKLFCESKKVKVKLLVEILLYINGRKICFVVLSSFVNLSRQH